MLILMTMTTPACPYAPELLQEVKDTLGGLGRGGRGRGPTHPEASVDARSHDGRRPGRVGVLLGERQGIAFAPNVVGTLRVRSTAAWSRTSRTGTLPTRKQSSAARSASTCPATNTAGFRMPLWVTLLSATTGRFCGLRAYGEDNPFGFPEPTRPQRLGSVMLHGGGGGVQQYVGKSFFDWQGAGLLAYFCFRRMRSSAGWAKSLRRMRRDSVAPVFMGGGGNCVMAMERRRLATVTS